MVCLSNRKNTCSDHSPDGPAAQHEQHKCSEDPKCAEHEADTPIRRSANIAPGREQKQETSQQPQRTPQEGIPVKHSCRSVVADGPTQGEDADDEEEAPMHEEEGPCAPDEQEQDPAGNPAAPRLDQREGDQPAEHFEEGSDPQHRQKPWHAGTRELRDFW